MLDGIRVRIVEKIVNKSKNLTKFEVETLDRKVVQSFNTLDEAYAYVRGRGYDLLSLYKIN